ncbi:hypothetical protein [Agrobacterium leguminum]|uniref:hypothetical protein n=1 Tax=Agrobacterium leguminum TaxID=2792015 RepID=UPI003CE5905E
MILKRSYFFLFAIACHPNVVAASDTTDAATQNNPAAAICMPLTDFQKFSVDEAGFILNNFSTREVKDIQSDMMQLETTYSIANRSNQPVRLSVDFVYLDKENSIIAALSGVAEEWRIEPAMTTKGKGKTFVATGTLGEVKTVCLRAFGTFPEKT